MKLIHTLQDQDTYKSRLLASVSHELRTPLNGSTSFIERVQEDDRVPNDLKIAFLLPAIRSNMLLINIINDILDFSQLQANKLKLNFTVSDVIEEVIGCIQLIEIQASIKEIRVVLESIDSTFNPDFCTDHNRFKQIVLNLLSNAIKFTEKGGMVRVRVCDLKRDSMLGKKRALKVEVEDTGVGISENDQKNLFTEFSRIDNHDRTSANPNGVGLGLMISNSLAKLLGQVNSTVGLEVSSVPGYGTTFSFMMEEKVEKESQRVPIIRPKPRIFDYIYVSNSLSPLHTPSNKISLSSSPVYSRNKQSINNVRSRISTIESIKITRTSNLLNFSDYSKTPGLDVSAANTNNRDDSNISFIPLEKSSHPISAKNITLDLAGSCDEDNVILDLSHQHMCDCLEVLIVDDDSFNVMALDTILKTLNYSSEHAFNGKEALEKAQRRYRNPCSSCCKFFKLILMDLTMPVMDGFQATQELKLLMSKGELPTTKIIACTALAESKDMQNALSAGMDGHCIKPVSKLKILNILKDLNIST